MSIISIMFLKGTIVLPKDKNNAPQGNIPPQGSNNNNYFYTPQGNDVPQGNNVQVTIARFIRRLLISSSSPCRVAGDFSFHPCPPRKIVRMEADWSFFPPAPCTFK